MSNNHCVLKPPILNLHEEHNYYTQKDLNVNNGKHTLDNNHADSPQNKKPLLESGSSQTEIMYQTVDVESNTVTDSSFALVRHRKSKSSPSNVPPSNERYKTVISNRFDVLSDNGEMESESIEADNVNNRIPPIFLHEANNHQVLIKDLDALLKSEYFTEVKGKSVKINVSSSDDFRTLTAHLDQLKVQYHSFCPPENKQLSVIMRNVPLSLSDDEIFNELQSQHYPVLKVARLYHKNKTPMPLCAIHLEDSDLGAEIFGLEFICHSKVQIEHKRQPKSIPQCTRCQRFGHTKNYCRLDPRCVKCTGSHHYTQCIKKKDDPVICVNCGEEHSANYKGCSHYLNLKAKVNKNKQNSNDQANTSYSAPVNNDNFPPLRKQNGNQIEDKQKNTQASGSYSNVVTGNKTRSNPSQQSSSNEPNENDSIHPILNSILSWLKQFIPQIKSFVSELITSVFTHGK